MTDTRIVAITYQVKDVVAELSLATDSIWTIENTGANRIFYLESDNAYVKGTLQNVHFLDPAEQFRYKVKSGVKLIMYTAAMDEGSSTIAISEGF